MRCHPCQQPAALLGVAVALVYVLTRSAGGSFTTASRSHPPAAEAACSLPAPCSESLTYGALHPQLASLVGMSDAAILNVSATLSMTRPQRMDTALATFAYVLAARVAGDFIEAGVARGGVAAALFLAAAARGDPRGLHLYDTFGAMPTPDAELDSTKALARVRPAFQAERLARHGRGVVEAYLSQVGVPRGMTAYHVGDIVSTPPAEVPCAVALFHLDTDWYASYAWALAHVFPRVSPGGVVLLDDYSDWPGAQKAVDEFLARPGNKGVGFRRTAPPMLCKPLRNGS